ncbi:MAG: hypothetical protein KKA67_02810 [Spirochaetes bacterium]|nr:hypothetical protein [Spirochaetota bacterium]MBU1081784.1 hypothetical protein [Spirochaetota bacterium]
MPNKSTGFATVAGALIAIAFALGFFLSLVSIGTSGVLFKFAIAWELTKALLYVAAWAPAIVLASSALAMESSSASDGFSGQAYRVMAPVLALAAIVSIFYLLVVPGLEERKNRYESQSQLFSDSLSLADEALREGRLGDAQRHLLSSAAIDQRDARFEALNSRVQTAEIKAKAAALGDDAATTPPPPKEDPAWKAGNRFYLEALEARKAGRLFDAHYLAKRSAALFSKRPEVTRLVADTWRDIQRLGPSAETKAAAAYYERKLDGYARFQEGDFLEAYRIYSGLAAEDSSDKDARVYLERSAEGLSTIAFFIEEDERAFSRSDERRFAITLSEPSGWSATIRASRAAPSEDAIYFRDLELEIQAEDPIRVSAPFARLHGNTLILRAVDRNRPELVWDPAYDARPKSADPGYALAVPFDQEDAATAIRFSGAPGDIPLAFLATGIDEASRLGIDKEPLLAELAGRTSYPFAVVMLALIGAGMGVRFKPKDAVGPVAKYLSAPVLVALAVPPIRVVAEAEAVAARAFAEWVPSGIFLPAWLAFMGACVVASLLVAARIADSR